LEAASDHGINFTGQPLPPGIKRLFAAEKRIWPLAGQKKWAQAATMGASDAVLRKFSRKTACRLVRVAQSKEELDMMLLIGNNGHREFHVVERKPPAGIWYGVYVYSNSHEKAARNKPRATKEQRAAMRRTLSGGSLANLEAIYTGFIEKGIDEDDIEPRVNVLTFAAWQALGRVVKKGEHGVKVTTWINAKGKEADEESESFRFPRKTTVFHISQTKELK
jgi:hypothetical protein